MWGYSVCAAGAPQLRFAVSLGVGNSSYTPTLDQANGLISLARLNSSVLVVSVEKAIELWNSLDPRTGTTPTPADARNPGGAGQGAIIQPFYLANPTTSPSADITLPAGTHWSAVLLPSMSANGSGASVDVAVGYSQSGTGGSGDALSGVPVWRKPYDAGSGGDTWIPESPYVGPATPYGAASDRALKGPAEVTRAGTRLGVVSGITVKVGIADPYPTNLVLAVQIGGAPGTSGNSHLAIIDEQDPANPKLRSIWPTTDILGSGVAFEVIRKQPVVDPVNHLVAVPLRKIGGTPGADATWFVLDLSTPETPTVVAVVPGMGWVGSFYDKKLTITTAAGMVPVDLGGAMGQYAKKLEKDDPERAKRYRLMAKRSERAALLTTTACSGSAKSLKIYDPNGPKTFYIQHDSLTGAPNLASFALKAKIINEDPDQTANSIFNWAGEITYSTLQSNPISLKTIFSRSSVRTVRGGNSPSANQFFNRNGNIVYYGGKLKINVDVDQIGSTSKNDIDILAKNPNIQYIKNEITEHNSIEFNQFFNRVPSSLTKYFSTIFNDKDKIENRAKQIACHESHMQPFCESDGPSRYWKKNHPRMSQDGLGGFGVFQITDSEIDPEYRYRLLWDWRAGVKKGINIFYQKTKWAMLEAKQMEDGALTLGIAEYNAWLKKTQGPQAPQLTSLIVEPLTDDQILENGIRAFNGMPGTALYGAHRIEYWLSNISVTPFEYECRQSKATVIKDYVTVTIKGKNRKRPSGSHVEFVETVFKKQVTNVLDINWQAGNTGIAHWVRFPPEKRVQDESNKHYVESVLSYNGEDCSH